MEFKTLAVNPVSINNADISEDQQRSSMLNRIHISAAAAAAH
jgi:hypothetical protein